MQMNASVHLMNLSAAFDEENQHSVYDDFAIGLRAYFALPHLPAFILEVYVCNFDIEYSPSLLTKCIPF